MNWGNRAEVYNPGFSLVTPASGVVLLYLKNKTSAKIMENSRPRLYFAGEGACSTTYLFITRAFGLIKDSIMPLALEKT